jgi:ABC-type Fe3+ transport system permease subunit
MLAVVGGVMLAGLAWREAAPAWPPLPRHDRAARRATRWALGAVAWAAASLLIAPLVIVAIRSAGGWTTLGAAGTALGASVALGLGAAIVGTTLAVAAAHVAERQPSTLGRIADALTSVPAVVPAIVAAVGWTLVGGRPAGASGEALPLAIAIVAAWELPTATRAARTALVRTTRAREQAAAILGAGGLALLTRIVGPALRPVAAGIAAHLFAAGVLAAGSVIVLTGARPGLGAITVLTLATTGAIGAACAVAIVLLVLAGGALVLGRAIAGRRLGPTLLT